MHLLFRETVSIDEADAAVSPDQTPAELIFLSFSDSDLAAVAAAWAASGETNHGLRVADLKRLRHPMSVDLYLEQVVSGARFVCARLLGGLDYWRYGAEELADFCRRNDIALALLAGDAHYDPKLAELSTLPADMLLRLNAFLSAGGPINLRRFLRFAATCANLVADPGEPAMCLPAYGIYHEAADRARPLAVIVFYRAHMLAGDLAPIDALLAALEAQGLATDAIYVASLKSEDCAAFVRERIGNDTVAVTLNATGFSTRDGDRESPLAAGGAPVLQLVLAACTEAAWRASARGLSQTDLAMQVVLPEMDGTLLAGAVSFKQRGKTDPASQYAPALHVPAAEGIEIAAARAAGWARLAATPRAARRIAIVLSDYPGGGQAAHAVGLDTLASLHVILQLLAEAGYDAGGTTPSAAALAGMVCDGVPTPFLPLARYCELFDALPLVMREAVCDCWGNAAADPAVQDNSFRLRHARGGNILVALQPDRGRPHQRRTSYHDPDLPPRHSYIAFYLWLRGVLGVDAILHLGTHGTLEWLPGKAVALSGACAPRALLGGLPVINPFIVNNPGEAAAAKRRIGAVTIGHLTPPLVAAGLAGEAREVERLIEEYSVADGLDRRRAEILRQAILERADSAGLLAESNIDSDADEQQTLTRLDAYLCDLKDLQIRDGLHVFGRPPPRPDALLASLTAATPGLAPELAAARVDACAAAERSALLAALDGRFVPPGPAGAPSRGRIDVLPTGRNLSATDLRAIPHPSALALAERQAETLLRRYRQDHGDYPRRLLLDLWGSASLRTGGEDYALALVLLGARPVWDQGSGRFTSIEVLPLAVLDRPRVDVSLRISGLFRDSFAMQIELYHRAARAIAARDEPGELNPLRGSEARARVWGPAPGCYGAGPDLTPGGDHDLATIADAYLCGGGHEYGAADAGRPDRAGFASCIAAADALVHPQDHAETDLLDGDEHAAHLGGFAAAAAMLAATPVLYQLDGSQPERPRLRTAANEVARIVRGRAANPRWIEGQFPHGYRGAAEIARALDGLFGFALTLSDRFDRQFDLLFDATLGDPTVDDFLRSANPAARAAMQARFRAARAAGLWRPRRNAVTTLLEDAT
jgi:cobaltochelatase CobN